MKKDVFGLNEPQEATLLSCKNFNNHFVSISDFLTEIEYKEVFKTEQKSSYPISLSQKRIYNLVNNSNIKSTDYSTTFGILFGVKLAPSKIQNILDELVKTHSSFRTIFKYENDEISQVVLENSNVTLEIERSSLDTRSFNR